MLSLRISGCCVVGGVLPLCWLASLPGLPLTGAAVLVAILLLLIPLRALRYTGLILLMACWACLAGHRVLWPATALTQGVIHAEGELLSQNEGGHTRVALYRYNGQPLFPRVNVRVRGLPASPEVCPGQRWSMHLRLRPVHGQLNIPGFDSQRRAVANRQILTGKVLKSQRLSHTCSWHSRLTRHITTAAGEHRHGAVIRALAFGDRRGLPEPVRQLFRDTGTAHLMAISGLHIAQSAGVFWLLARLVQWLLPAAGIGVRIPLLVGILGAALYCWVSGANPPALRALLALMLWSLLRLSGRKWPPETVWLCCVAGILFADPLTILSDSFRLSACATGALVLWYRWVPFDLAAYPRGWRYLAGLGHLQLGISALLLPAQVIIFHGVSLSAFAANMVAVPLVSLLVVPLLLVGMLTSGIPGAAWLCWWLADNVLDAVLRVMHWLPPGWLALDSRATGLAFIPLVVMVTWRLGWYRSSPALVLAMLLACTSGYWPTASGGLRWAVHMLDVGNGLAVVVEKDRRALLYDTGNRWPGGDSGQQAIIPWLRWRGLAPDGVIISHGHLDHIGGLGSIQRAWPGLPVYSAMLTPGHRPCFAGEAWRWQGLSLQVLWPPRSRPGAENNHSCVVRISDGTHSILLTGDIERAAELAMLKTQRGNVQASVLQVPHHGSRTSSTGQLLQWVNPQAALASVARYNPWRFPAHQVVQRYRQRGIDWHDTGQSGQITVQMFSDRLEILSARKQIYPRWYHQWFGVPADSG
ncbi:DNA internalization-related competence protein ComEC/Rec2 [Shimwellia pseudoproteus]|uniref:DNA internalization-related competence protein ComEC/Rec2 n=1 Tax=Shimwellia pseudoproteus TaxID=570012 RepID=UPI0018EC9AF3|nr:DNA internalization-related competence protein ComEC/Rec2 [Shimwellia pseudoproteus]MBJ3815259.1 DNA internalization-related competence protein ComEC/Rec2 [Shimwellia pseudoproteus]